MTDHQLIRYAFLIVANHEMYAVEPGWRLFAICLTTGAAYEMHGGFNGSALAIACRDGFIGSGMDPAQEPATFTRLNTDAVLVAVSPPSKPTS